MKKFCFVILITFIFGDILIPKYGSAKSTLESNVFYFKTKDFDDGSTIYFQWNADNGYVNGNTVYEFSNISPVSGYHLFNNPIIIKAYNRAGSKTYVIGRGTSYTENYYYEIKNDRNYDYLYIKYNGFQGNYLEAENTRFSIGILILIIVGIVAGTIILSFFSIAAVL